MSERPRTDYGNCDYCGDPLPKPHPKSRTVQRFCCGAHRAKWRRRELDRRVSALLDAATELQRFLGGER